jgi:hypothetical protein
MTVSRRVRFQFRGRQSFSGRPRSGMRRHVDAVLAFAMLKAPRVPSLSSRSLTLSLPPLRLSPTSSATASSPRPHTRVTIPQLTKSCPQLRHHLTNLVNHSIGAGKLRVSDITFVASTAQHSSIPSHPRFIFLVVYRSLGEDVISWFDL